MSDLYPTPTRLDLLRDVADGYVYHVFQRTAQYAYNQATYGRVTAKLRELEQAGWVRLGDMRDGFRYWLLTDAGRAVLDAHGGERDG